MKPVSNAAAIYTALRPAFLLNVPLSLDTRIPNNATMRELGPDGRRINRPRMLEQWHALYHHLAARAAVYLLPSQAGLQDQPFVANLALIPPHAKKPFAVLARFRARGRAGEVKAGAAFFKSLGFAVEQSPAFFEGEADLKCLRGHLYAGGHGLRSSPRAHAWLEKEHGFRILPIPLRDPHLYHLDCVLHVLAPHRILAAIHALSAAATRALERESELIEVPLSLAYRGATNVARVGSEILCDSSLAQLKKSDALYAVERAKRAFLEKTAARENLKPVFFNLSEFYKSGAMLSCLVLPMNYPHLSLRKRSSA